jgi:hypothetical protein
MAWMDQRRLFAKHIIFLAIVVVQLILLNQSMVFAAPSKSMCASDPNLKLYIKELNDQDPDGRLKRISSMKFALYLSLKVKPDRPYCGFSASNVLFLTRCASNPVQFPEPVPSRSGVENPVLILKADIADFMSRAFSSGSFGLKKSHELSSCWRLDQKSITNCFLLERKRFGKIIYGERPQGVSLQNCVLE